MDWNAAVERNREALKRILATLVAMAGLGAILSSLLVEEGGSARRGKAKPLVEPGEGYLNDRPTLPRHLHRAVLRLLRPAEAAARRLVIVAARGLVVELPRPRPRKPDPKAAHAALRGLGIAVVMSPADYARAAAGKSRRPHPEAGSEAESRRALLPLLDPLPRLLSLSKAGTRRTVPPHSAPRILFFDGVRPHRLPPPPSPDDPIDARRLALRLQAVASALDDLPAHARRFARWRAARDAAGAQIRNNAAGTLNKGSRDAPSAQNSGRSAGRFRRLSPLRPGRPPGQRPANSRRPAHEVHEVLSDLQYFAFKALERPDTS